MQLRLTVARYQNSPDLALPELGECPQAWLVQGNEDDDVFQVILPPQLERCEQLPHSLMSSTEERWGATQCEEHAPSFGAWQTRIMQTLGRAGDAYQAKKDIYRLRTEVEGAGLAAFDLAAVLALIDHIMWDSFAIDVYVANNYRSPIDFDQAIVHALEQAYQTESVRQGGALRVVDVGGGPNLYPLLAAAPFAERIDYVEYSQANCDYIQAHLGEAFDHETWGQWAELASETMEPEQVIAAMQRSVQVHQGDLYTLPQYTRTLQRRWQAAEGEPPEQIGGADELADVVSMHFVAESITDQPAMFREGVQSAVESTRPGGAMMMSFVVGNNVNEARYGDHFHPVMGVEPEQIRQLLAELGCSIVSEQELTGAIQRQDGSQQQEGVYFVHARRG